MTDQDGSASAPPSQNPSKANASGTAPMTHGRALPASLWQLGGEAVANILRLATSLILSRLLSPEITGLMSLLSACAVGIHMFSDLGIRAIVVQHRRGDDPDFYNTAWTVQIVRGFFLWICAAMISWPLAWFYKQPSLVYLLPVLSLAAIIDGFTSTKLYSCERYLNQKRLTQLSLCTQLIFIAVTTAWAFRSPSIWALVVGNVAGPLTRTVLSHVMLPGPRNHLHWDAESRRDIMLWGRWISVSSIFAFGALQADRLVFGKMIPMTLLGVYTTGAMYARLPVDVLSKLANSVAYPMFTRRFREEGSLKSIFRRVCLPILTVGGAGLGALILGGPSVIRVLYDVRWHQAGWMIQLVCIGAWFQMVEGLNTLAVGAMGQPQWPAIGNSIKLAVMLPVLPLAYKFFGFTGALWAIALTELPRYAVARWRTLRAGLGNWKVELGLTVAILGCYGVALLIRRGQSGFLTPWGSVLVAGLAYLAIWLPLGLWSYKVWKSKG